MADEGWSGIFDDPIPLPDGGGLRTLRDVGNSHDPDPRQHGVAAMVGERSTSILRQPALPGSIRSSLGFSSSKANRSAGASFISVEQLQRHIDAFIAADSHAICLDQREGLAAEVQKPPYHTQVCFRVLGSSGPVVAAGAELAGQSRLIYCFSGTAVFVGPGGLASDYVTPPCLLLERRRHCGRSAPPGRAAAGCGDNHE